MTTCDPNVRKVLMSLLKRGAISVAQAAELGCVSRQAVQRWVDKAGWDMKRRQDAFAAREFSRLLGSGRTKSKGEMRREAGDASRMWEWRHDEAGLEPGDKAH